MSQDNVHQINIFVLDAALEALHKEVIQRATAPVHTNRNAALLECASKRVTGKLTALIGVKYLRHAVTL